MRIGKTLAVALALALVASCGQQSAQAPSEEVAAPAAPSDLFAGFTNDNWGVYGGTYADNRFSLEPQGSIATQRSGRAIEAGDDYTAEVSILADAAGQARLRLSSGCGATEPDQSIVNVDIAPGANTLRTQHVFEQGVGCPRVTLIAVSPLAFELTGARLLISE